MTHNAGARSLGLNITHFHRELDEYLEDPLETFSRIERVEGVEKRVVFDLITFWQVCAAFLSPANDPNLTAGSRKPVHKLVMDEDGRSSCPSTLSAMRASLLIWEGDLHRSSQPDSSDSVGEVFRESRGF